VIHRRVLLLRRPQEIQTTRIRELKKPNPIDMGSHISPMFLDGRVDFADGQFRHERLPPILRQNCVRFLGGFGRTSLEFPGQPNATKPLKLLGLSILSGFLRNVMEQNFPSWGAGGRRFKSSRPDQMETRVSQG
jgi:hypothetical protein